MKGGKTVSWLLALTVAIGTFTGTSAFAAGSDSSDESGKSPEPKITLEDVPTEVPTETAVEEAEGAVDSFTPGDRTPIKVSLDPNGTTYEKVRVEVEIDKEDSEETENFDGIQLLAKDSKGKWYDIVKTGWGTSEGFQLATATTPVYLVASEPGTYDITVKLIDKDGNDAVLTQEKASVTAAESVGSKEELKTACGDGDDAPSAIILTDNIDLDAPLEVKHPLKIDGNGKTLTFSGLEEIATEDSDVPKLDDGLIFKEGADGSVVQDLTVDAGLTDSKTWVGTYAIHAYKADTVTLKDVTARGGNAGILVNGSNVTLEGTIDVSGNGFGGIEVSQGEDVSEDSQLTIDEDAELENSSESATNPTAWLVSTKDEDGADVFQGKITDEGRHFAVTNRVAKDDETVQTQYFLTAGNARLAPADDWKGPAGEPGTIYAKDSQPFTFSFKESNVVKQKLLDAKKKVAPVLRLTIYLNGERGTGEKREDSYDNSVKIPLPPVSGSDRSVTDDDIKTAITAGLSNITGGQTQEKTNTIELLEAAGVTFDENDTPTSVEEFRKNISYQDGTWTVRLNTKKLLSDEISKIEFLVKPSLNLTADKTEENPFGISDTKVLQLGNNNYFKQDTFGLTQAYLYNIDEPETVTAVSPLPSSVKTQWVKKGSAPNLPGTLTVNDGEAVSGVTWTSSPAYDSAKTGTYTFTPVLPEGYELGEGVTLPTITVKVYKPSDDDNDDDDKEENKPLNPVIPAPTPSGSFVSDTTRDFSVNGTYQFRITSKDGKEPTFVIGTPGVFEIQSVTRSGNDYFFKLRAIGAPGDKAGIYVNNGQRLLVATVGSNPNYAKLDTGKQLPVKAGRTYQFRVTAAKKPTFVCGTGSAFRVAYAGSRGNDYFFKVTATGKPGDKAGFYLNGEKAPRTIGTIVA